MKAEDIIDVLKDIPSSHEVTNIAISEDGMQIRHQRELVNKHETIKKTKLCPTLANMTVQKFQEYLHTCASMNADMYQELIVIEKQLSLTNKALGLYEELNKRR